MSDAEKTRIFDGKHNNQQVRLRYNLEKASVRIICTDPENGSDYLRQLITGGHIGLIDSVLYSATRNSRVVALIRGNNLDQFLRSGTQPTPSKTIKKKSFSQMASESETGS